MMFANPKKIAYIKIHIILMLSIEFINQQI